MKKDRLNNLMVTFGCSRSSSREVGSDKHLRASVLLLQEEYEDILDYDLDLRCWGAESSAYGKDFNKFLHTYHILSGRLYLERRNEKPEPIHHKYITSGASLPYLLDSISNFVKEKKIDDESKRDFVTDAIARIRFIPKEITITESLNLESKSNGKSKEIEEELRVWPVMKRSDKEGNLTKPMIVFDSDVIKELKDIYQSVGIELEGQNGKYIVRIPADLANRYHYLDPGSERVKKELEEAEFRWEEWNPANFLYIADLFDEGWGGALEEIEERINGKIDEIKRNTDLNNLEEKYAKEKNMLWEILKATNDHNFYMGIEKDKVTFRLSEDLKKAVKNLSESNGHLDSEVMIPSAYLYYYHTLQPLELGLLLKRKKSEEIIKELSNGS